MVKELCEKVVEVRRASDRVMAVVINSEHDALTMIYGHALQSIILEGKQSFYER